MISRLPWAMEAEGDSEDEDEGGVEGAAAATGDFAGRWTAMMLGDGGRTPEPGWCRICDRALRSTTATVHCGCLKTVQELAWQQLVVLPVPLALAPPVQPQQVPVFPGEPLQRLGCRQEELPAREELAVRARCRLCGRALRRGSTATVHAGCRRSEVAQASVPPPPLPMSSREDATTASAQPRTFSVRPGGDEPGTAQYLRHDFLCNTRYERVVARLLVARGWRECPPLEPLQAQDAEVRDLVWCGTDVQNVPAREILGASTAEAQHSLCVSLRGERTATSSAERAAVRSGGVYRNCFALSRSRLGNRIPLITLLLSDKALMCELMARDDDRGGTGTAGQRSCLPPFLTFSTAQALELDDDRLPSDRRRTGGGGGGATAFERRVEGLLGAHPLASCFVLRCARSSRGAERVGGAGGVHLLERSELVSRLRKVALVQVSDSLRLKHLVCTPGD
jgi:hypothetical protein